MEINHYSSTFFHWSNTLCSLYTVLENTLEKIYLTDKDSPCTLVRLITTLGWQILTGLYELHNEILCNADIHLVVPGVQEKRGSVDQAYKSS